MTNLKFFWRIQSFCPDIPKNWLWLTFCCSKMLFQVQLQFSAFKPCNWQPMLLLAKKKNSHPKSSHKLETATFCLSEFAENATRKFRLKVWGVVGAPGSLFEHSRKFWKFLRTFHIIVSNSSCLRYEAKNWWKQAF